MRPPGSAHCGCMRRSLKTAHQIRNRRKTGGTLHIEPATLHNWIRKAGVTEVETTTQTEQEKDTELNQLRRENKQLKQANEIVKLASAFRPSRSRQQTKVIVAFLHEHQHLFSIEQMCQVLQDHEHEITAGTYYRHLGGGIWATDAE